MKQEDKEPLLKDLSARLPYGVKVYAGEDLAMTLKQIDYKGFCESWENEDFKCHSRWMFPYLRPLSSMTEEEKEELSHLLPKDWSVEIDKLNNFYFNMSPSIFMEIDVFLNIIDWLNKYHFDYRSLIEKGLALEAPEGMYN